jgi:hypothetical protein
VSHAIEKTHASERRRRFPGGETLKRKDQGHCAAIGSRFSGRRRFPTKELECILMAAYLAGDLEIGDLFSWEMVSSAGVPMRQCKKWKQVSTVGESNWHKGRIEKPNDYEGLTLTLLPPNEHT